MKWSQAITAPVTVVTSCSVSLCRKGKALEVMKKKRKMERRKCHQLQQLPQQDWARAPQMRRTMKMTRYPSFNDTADSCTAVKLLAMSVVSYYSH